MRNQTVGTGIGKGHGGNTPNLPVIRPVQHDLAGLQPGTKAYKMGKCHILVSPPYQDMGWHMSISRTDRYPSWDEIAHAWYSLVPETDQRTGALILPPKADYINLHNFCMQVHEELKS